MSEVIANRIEITDLILGPCEDCGILNQFLLPCCHYLVRAYTTGEMIPRSLIHPRWWLNGPQINFFQWKPSYTDDILGLPSPSPNPGRRASFNYSSSQLKMDEIHKQLNSEN